MAGRTAAVVGGGIGGLATAVALHHRGWRVRVLERAPDFTELGAGLSVWPNGVRAMESLGLGDGLRAIGAVESGGGVRNRAGRWLSRTENAEIERRYGRSLVLVHRADLLRTLLAALPPDCLWPGREVRRVVPGDRAVLIEHRHGLLHADLVVGADGLRSAVRRQCWPGAPSPRRAGYTAWRTITGPLTRPPADGAVFWDRGERIGYASLPGDRCYLFAAATAATVPAGRRAVDGELAALRRRFGNWPDPIPALLAAVSPERLLRHDMYRLPQLSTYVRGRVVLVGDAAHAMDPILGQGACQALEDAVELAAYLDSADDIHEALAGYDRARRPRTQAVVRRSARVGRLARWSWPPAALARDLFMGLVPARTVLRSMGPVLGWAPPGSSAPLVAAPPADARQAAGH